MKQTHCPQWSSINNHGSVGLGFDHIPDDILIISHIIFLQLYIFIIIFYNSTPTFGWYVFGTCMVEYYITKKSKVRKPWSRNRVY